MTFISISIDVSDSTEAKARLRSLTHEEAEVLAVRVDDLEQPVESQAEYVARFQKTLPNVPPDVISQWFYDHRQAIFQNSWLPLSQLRFHLAEVTLEEVTQPAFADNQIVAQYRSHFENENTSCRMGRIAEFVKSGGTWPMPPIALANPQDKIVSPWGMKCDSPYHLLEGHHRFAVLLAGSNASALLPIHKIWVAQWPE